MGTIAYQPFDTAGQRFSRGKATPTIQNNQAQDDWHFINAKYDESPNPLGKGAKRLLRRIVVNRREQLRTAIEQISELDLQAIARGCEKKTIELEPLEIQI